MIKARGMKASGKIMTDYNGMRKSLGAPKRTSQSYTQHYCACAMFMIVSPFVL